MTYLSVIPDDAPLMSVFEAFPDTARPIMQLHEVVMRAPSPLTDGERELLAAYVSGVNDCEYCHGVHAVTAEAFGVPAGLLRDMLDDLDSADVDPRLRPLLRYAEKLTRTPAKVTTSDAEAVRAAGWDDAALHATVMVCGLFNLMNRMVEGFGVSGGPDYYRMSGQRLHDIGYAGLAAKLQS